MPDARRYDTLLAKGEDRKQRILAVAQRLLIRNGWRNTTLAQIAGAAGVTPAGCCTTSRPRSSCCTRCSTPATRMTTPTPTAPAISSPDLRGRRSIPPGAGAGGHLHGVAGREHPPRRAAARPHAGAAPGRCRHRRRAHPQGPVRGPVPRRDRPHHQGSRNTRLRPRNGNHMVARSFDTADRGVQAVRRDAGAGLRAVEEALDPPPSTT